MVRLRAASSPVGPLSRWGQRGTCPWSACWGWTPAAAPCVRQKPLLRYLIVCCGFFHLQIHGSREGLGTEVSWIWKGEISALVGLRDSECTQSLYFTASRSSGSNVLEKSPGLEDAGGRSLFSSSFSLPLSVILETCCKRRTDVGIQALLIRSTLSLLRVERIPAAW